MDRESVDSDPTLCDSPRHLSVTEGSKWELLDTKHPDNRWIVTGLWKFEQGSGRELLAVTIRQGKSERHMSQARLLATMREVSK